jgi:hypothetical protein
MFWTYPQNMKMRYVEHCFLLVLTTMTADEVSTEEGKMVRVMVIGVLNLDTPLPVIVRDVNGKVICLTLGEAFQKGISVWWLEGDLEVTYDAGCSIRNSIKPVCK